MATPAFPGPKLDKIIDTDPQIVKVPMDYMEFGARQSALPKNTKNSMTLKHVGGSDK